MAKWCCSGLILALLWGYWATYELSTDTQIKASTFLCHMRK